jgi:hypothetical protein
VDTLKKDSCLCDLLSEYDFTANINIRSNSRSDVKSRINDVDLEADIVATSQRPL